MNKTLTHMTPEKFAEIYTDEKLRNEVAFAHGFTRGAAQGRKTCSYPDEYIVTDEQIKEAQAERERAKKRTIETNKGNLLFTGMGMVYEPRFDGDICNHRIRAEFSNAHGRRFFLEIGTAYYTRNCESFRVDHAIDRTRQQELNDAIDKQGEFYNYRGLEVKRPMDRHAMLLRYDHDTVLKFVNDNFNCHFKAVVIDNYNVSTDDVISESPQDTGKAA